VARRAPWLWPYGGLALVLALAMWPAWSTSDRLIVGGDAPVIHYPWFVLWRDALAAGEFPFWNPYSFSGLPAFATLQAGYAYPPHWILTPLQASRAMNWLLGLHVLLAGLGAAWCAGRLGAGKDGQFLSGLAYALGSATVARLWAGHLSFLESNAWLPWATGLAGQIGQRRFGLYLALVVGLMALAGQPELIIMSLWWLPLWAGAGSLGAALKVLARNLFKVGLAVGLGIGLAAFQLLPVLAGLAISNRQTGMAWDFLTGASLPPWHLLGAFAPLLFGDPRQGYWPGPDYEWHERLLFVGLVPLTAALLARGRWRWICWGGAALAVALAFGGYAPWYAWIQALPGYQSFRIPSKHLILAALALALAAGLGLPYLAGRRAALTALGLAVLLGLATLTLPHWLPPVALLAGGSEALAEPGVREALGPRAAVGLLPTSIVLALVGLLALGPARWARPGLLLLAALELVLVLQPFRIHPFDPARIVADAALLRDHAKAAVIGEGGAILANYGPVIKVIQPVGYVSLFSAEYMALLTGGANPGVAMDVGRADDPALGLLGYGVLIDRQKRLVTIVEPPPLQVWVARCVWPGGAREVREPGFPRQACITRAAAAEREAPVPAGPARLLAERAGWLQVEAEGPGWLVTTQPWYPGWSAWIGGAPIPVEAVDGALVGAWLPAGTQVVTLSYRPAGLEQGALISLASGLALMAWWWWEQRDRRLATFNSRR
jgi:hypothetical protein